MKRAQVVGLAIAAGAAIGAVLIMKTMMGPGAPKEVVVEKKVGGAKILVAADAVPLGESVTPASLKWMDWPEEAIPSGTYITERQRPNAKNEFTGAIVTSPLSRFEPITEAKLVKAGQGGVLASILPKGKRAVATKVTQVTAAAKLILPNDRVDVILTVRKRNPNGVESLTSKTLFVNVRVLSMGQQLSANKDQKDAAQNGDVATLELTPDQAEELTRANMLGQLSLSLRSVADMKVDPNPKKRKRKQNAVRLHRYGIEGHSSQVN